MRIRFFGLMSLASVVLLAGVLLLPEMQAQQRRPSRRTTNPARPQPAVPVPTPSATQTQRQNDVTLISSADDQTPADENRPPARRTTNRTRRADAEAEDENMRRTVLRLSTQVKSLSEDLSEVKEQQQTLVNQQRTLVELERLTRAEQRAEGFRAQLRDVVEKQLAQEARAEQLEYELEPGSIERRAGMTGSLNPAALREQIRRQLESEKSRVQQQIDLLTTSRRRLEAAILSADTEVERLRARMEENDRRENEAGATTNTPAADIIRPATPNPTPAPTPDEPR